MDEHEKNGNRMDEALEYLAQEYDVPGEELERISQIHNTGIAGKSAIFTGYKIEEELGTLQELYKTIENSDTTSEEVSSIQQDIEQIASETLDLEYVGLTSTTSQNNDPDLFDYLTGNAEVQINDEKIEDQLKGIENPYEVGLGYLQANDEISTEAQMIIRSSFSPLLSQGQGSEDIYSEDTDTTETDDPFELVTDSDEEDEEDDPVVAELEPDTEEDDEPIFLELESEDSEEDDDDDDLGTLFPDTEDDTTEDPHDPSDTEDYDSDDEGSLFGEDDLDESTGDRGPEDFTEDGFDRDDTATDDGPSDSTTDWGTDPGTDRGDSDDTTDDTDPTGFDPIDPDDGDDGPTDWDDGSSDDTHDYGKPDDTLEWLGGVAFGEYKLRDFTLGLRGNRRD